MLEYMQNLRRRTVSPFVVNPLVPFSHPRAIDGYCDNCITNDLITHILNEFSERTRKNESEKYLQTLSGEDKIVFRNVPPTYHSFSAKCIALDNTFKSAGKATVVDKEKRHIKLMKGGILNVLNENGEIIGWVSGASQSVIFRLLRRSNPLATLPECLTGRDYRIP